MAAELGVLPLISQVDELLEIKMQGLGARETITLTAEQADLFGGLWRSETVYIANGHGEVDLSRDMPQSGGYNWVEPMGPIFAMKATQEPGKSIGILLQTPESFETTFKVKRKDGSTLEQKVVRRWMAEGVRREEIRGNGLFASLYLPEGKGPFPTVVVLTGSDGGINETTAALLASHGFAAFALAYFNYEALPKQLIDIPIEYFEKAIEYLKKRSEVKADKIGVTGTSYGGMLSLLLASLYPEFKAVAAYSPSCYLFGGIGGDYDLPIASFTRRGKPLPFLQYMKNTNAYFKEKGALGPIWLTDYYKQLLEEASSEDLESSATKVEKINGPVLLISGEDDGMWPSSWFCETAVKRMKDKGFAWEYEHICYPKTGHFIPHPYVPFPVKQIMHPVDHNCYAFGGSDKGNVEAMKDSWPKTLAFFKKALS